MMNRYGTLLALLVIVVSTEVEASCSMAFRPRMAVIPGKIPELEEVIETSDCPLSLQTKGRDLVVSINGRPSSAYLASAMGRETGDAVHVTPPYVEVISLKELIEKELGASRNVKSIALTDGATAIALPLNAVIGTSCTQCPPSGQGLIELHVGGQKKYWIRATYSARAKALVSVRTINNIMAPLSASDFEERVVDVHDPAMLFQDRDQLRFVRPTRPLMAGSPLSVQDTIAIFAVVPGIPVDMTYSSTGIQLSAKGTALGSAKIGERVTIRTPMGNRTVTGKVIDFNKVDLAL